MKVIEAIGDMQAQSRAWRQAGLRVGLVPTMGALHDGHLSLIRLATKLANRVVVSIFVNPAQFGENEDFAAYPRDFERDRDLCAQHGVGAIFHPDAGEMYAPDFSTWVVEESLSRPWCGEYRPGHFRGVATVVVKLCNAVLPEVAVFGEKDAQQALVVERIIRDLNLPVEIATGPTVREPDGLAMSSRNRYLDAEQRHQAAALPRGLALAREAFLRGERRGAALAGLVKREIVAAGGRLQYAEVRSLTSLELLETVDRPALLAVAAHFGKTRLIDNCRLHPEPPNPGTSET